MNEPVFADSGGWNGFLWDKDPLHQRANDQLERAVGAKRTLLTTAAIVLEVVDGLAARRLRHFSQTFQQYLLPPHVGTVELAPALLQRGWKLFDARLDKEWSLTDCLSFTVMNERGLTNALAFDHHFEQAGFRALLREGYGN